MWSDVTDSYHPDACAQRYRISPMTLSGCSRFTVMSTHNGVRNRDTISSEPDSLFGEFTKASESRISEIIIIVAPPFVARMNMESHITFHCDDGLIGYPETLTVKLTV